MPSRFNIRSAAVAKSSFSQESKSVVVQESGVAIEEERGSPVASAPAPSLSPLSKYEISYGEHRQVVKANDELEARALFNDQNKMWPSPKAVQVTLVK
jgi:hypothetical protein